MTPMRRMNGKWIMEKSDRPILTDINEMIEMLLELAEENEDLDADEIQDIWTQWTETGCITSDQLDKLRTLVVHWGIADDLSIPLRDSEDS